MFKQVEEQISTPQTPLTSFYNDLQIDEQGNIYDFRNGKYYKIGYTTPMLQVLYSHIAPISLTAFLTILFFYPSKHMTKQDKQVSYVVKVIFFVLAALLLFGGLIGFAINKILTSNIDKFSELLEKNKNIRLLLPNSWFTGKLIITGYYYLAFPVLAIIALLVNPNNIDPNSGFAIILLAIYISYIFNSLLTHKLFSKHFF